MKVTIIHTYMLHMDFWLVPKVVTLVVTLVIAVKLWTFIKFQIYWKRS